MVRRGLPSLCRGFFSAWACWPKDRCTSYSFIFLSVRCFGKITASVIFCTQPTPWAYFAQRGFLLRGSFPICRWCPSLQCEFGRRKPQSLCMGKKPARRIGGSIFRRGWAIFFRGYCWCRLFAFAKLLTQSSVKRFVAWPWDRLCFSSSFF